MAVPIKGSASTTHTVKATDSSSLDPVQSFGGVYIDGGTTSASPAITTRRTPGSDSVGMKGVIENNSATGAFHTVKCNDGAAFGYSAAGKYIMIGGGSQQGTIAGLSNALLDGAGSKCARKSVHLKVAQYGAKTLTAHRAGNWRDGGVAGQRHNWSSYPSALTETYKAATGSGDVDLAARPTRAIPGYLFMLTEHTDFSQTSSGISGADPVNSGNFVQYEAKNG